MSNYPRCGLSYISFACEKATVSSETVRQAIVRCLDREQLVTVLFRWAGDDGVRADLSAFPDAGSVARYARDAMAWAVGRGIVNGVGSGSVSTLSPRAGASRAQVAAMLMRCLTQDRPTEVIR